MYSVEIFLCAQYTFLMYSMEVVVSVHSKIFLVYSEESVLSVHITHFWVIVWKFLFCAKYTFLRHSVENVVSVHSTISDVPSRMLSVSVHSTQFWCPVIYFLNNRFLSHVLFCLYSSVLVLHYWRQLQYLCNMKQDIPFRMNVLEVSPDLQFRDDNSIACYSD